VKGEEQNKREGKQKWEEKLHSTEADYHQKREELERLSAVLPKETERVEWMIAYHCEETNRWTDYIFQAVQYIARWCKDDITYEDVERTFPFLNTLNFLGIPEDPDDVNQLEPIKEVSAFEESKEEL